MAWKYTLKQIREAYARHPKWKPLIDQFLARGDYCCPMTVLCFDKVGVDKALKLIRRDKSRADRTIGLILGVDPSHVRDFVCVFDDSAYGDLVNVRVKRTALAANRAYKAGTLAPKKGAK